MPDIRQNSFNGSCAPNLATWASVLLKEARRISGSTLFHGEEGIKSAAAELLSLQRGLTGERKLISSVYLNDIQRLASYLLYYWPVSYAQVQGILDFAVDDAFDESFSKPLIHILDLGSGPAPAAIAAADWHKTQTERLCYTKPLFDITAADWSDSALESACRLANEAGYTVKPIRSWRADIEPPPEGSYDYILVSHLLNEISKGSISDLDRHFSFLDSLKTRLADNGLLVVIEPATHEANRHALRLRDCMIAADWHVLSPCLFAGPCPALAKDGLSCHSEFHWKPPRTVQDIASRSGLDKKSVKASAFVFSRSAPKREGLIDEFRVVSDQLRNKAGRFRLLLCGPAGRASLSAAGNDTSPAFRSFSQLRRSDRVRLSGLITRPSGYAIGPNTQIEKY